MSLGRLTPLGRELRSVLLGLRNLAPNHAVPTLVDHSNRRCISSHSSTAQVGRRPASNAAALAIPTEEPRNDDDGGVNPYQPFCTPRPEDVDCRQKPSNPTEQTSRPTEARQRGRISPRRSARRDYISEALRAIGRDDVVAYDSSLNGKPNISYLNLWSSNGVARYLASSAKHKNDSIVPLEVSRRLKMSRILASYIVHSRSDHEQPFELDKTETDLLQRNGYGLEDVQKWAGWVTQRNCNRLADHLLQHILANGDGSVPFFLLAYILRRPHIPSSALNTLMRIARRLLLHGTSTPSSSRSLTSNAVFIIFLRLLRHARLVAPKRSGYLARLLVECLPLASNPSSKHPSGPVHILTYQLNKALSLIAQPTPIDPFKSRVFQEVGMVQILIFMAEHNPPIDVNRDGYRAVTQIQLGRNKTSNDQAWAVLKSKAWPPWKIDRTAMDAHITHDNQGVSKAAEILHRMQQAGYGRQNWETSAMVSAGWDVDGTPTIQTRTLVPANIGPRNDMEPDEAAIWGARIATTRTAQEAWACYLAFEYETRVASAKSSTHPRAVRTHSVVYLAILHKLHQEDQRLEKKSTRTEWSTDDGLPALHSGDFQEIEPPPSSAHQHTYTSRPPPTVDAFYQELQDRGIVLTGRCLAFVVAHASSLKNGLRYLLDNVSEYPDIRALIQPNGTHRRLALPTSIFAAFIQLLSRFSGVPISSALPAENLSVYPLFGVGDLYNVSSRDGRIDYPLILACELLDRHRPLYTPMWTSILTSLGHTSSLLNLHRAQQRSIRSNFLRATGIPHTNNYSVGPMSVAENQCLGAMTAYRLVHRLHVLMEDIHLALNIEDFKAWCHTLENVTVAWCLFIRQLQSLDVSSASWKSSAQYIRATGLFEAIMRDRTEFRTRFAALVGEIAESEEAENMDTDAGESEQLRLHNPPPPFLLHAYIRTLGWLADYDGLLTTVKWMANFENELATKRSENRRGDDLMRKALIALRVFLERTWFASTDAVPPAVQRSSVGDSANEDGAGLHEAQFLDVMSRPAEKELIDEAKTIVESVEAWGGWPTEEEVQRYCEHVSFMPMRQTSKEKERAR